MSKAYESSTDDCRLSVEDLQSKVLYRVRSVECVPSAEEDPRVAINPYVEEVWNVFCPLERITGSVNNTRSIRDP